MSPYQRYQFHIVATLLIITVTSLALFLKIGDLPPLYPWSDESEIAADAVATLRGGPHLFYPGQLAGGSLAVWLEAGWMALFGKSLWGLRLLNGLVNLASVCLLYGLVNQLPLLPPAANRWLALTASLLMGVSTWTLGLGRIATPNWSLVPLLMVGAFFCLWYSLHRRRPIYLVIMGLLMGLLFYGYLPGYLGPLIPLTFGGIAYWMTGSQTLPLPSLRSWLTAYLLMAIIASPILIYLTLNPTAALQRPWQLADTNELTATQSWLASGLDMLATFGLWPAWLLQGRFDQLAFDPLVTMLFVGGLLITLRRWREPAYLFLLIWWLVMMSPALLSRSASQGFIFEVWRRGVGAQPVSFILPALALVTLGQQLQRAFQSDGKLVRPLPSGHADKDVGAPGQRRWPTTNRPVWLIGLLSSAVIISAGFSYELYAVRWANSPAIPTLFAQTPVEMVEWMTTESAPATLFLFPTRPHVSPTTRPDLFTVRYLYDGATAFPVMNEATVDTVMQQLLADQQPATVKLMVPTRLTVDPKGYFDYALSGWGNRQSQEERFGYHITTYHHRDEPASASTSPTPIERSVIFGEALQLVQQQHHPASVAAGESLAVALRWRKLTDQAGNFNSRLTLYDPAGYDISHLERPLLSVITYQPTQDWPPNSESTIYYSLAIPPDAPPGTYILRVVIYEAQTGQPLPATGGNADLSFDVAEITLRSNPQPVEPDQLAIGQPLERQFANGLQLLGVAPASIGVQQPGNEMWLSLWWQTPTTVEQEVGLMLALVIPDGKPQESPITLFEQPQPVIPDYPTTAWSPGQIYRANYRLLWPPTLSSGEYLLAGRLIDLTTQQSLGEQGLTSLTIEARNHIFEAAPLGQIINRDFADLIRLRSAEFTISADRQMMVALQWQALQEMSTAYKFFIHLTDANGRIISQVDRQPQQGAAPTTSWLTNELIHDELMLSLPATELTTYRLLVGWYNPHTGERLRVGQQDYLVLTEP